MKYMVGYQLRKSDDFLQAILLYQEHIHEVYFSWGDMPSGRNSLGNGEYLPWKAQEQQRKDLRLLADGGLKLNLLFNANCYGKYSQSKALFEKIGGTVDFVLSEYGLQSITTTSPIIARFVKTNFPTLEVRASINMDIGTEQGMDYIAQWFDGYYMRREYNRNCEKMEELSSWCKENGKQLYFLANSGCLNNCSAHVFHDNLVAHENELQEMDNAMEFTSVCRDYLRRPEKKAFFLRDTNFIRPEDISLYDEWFTVAKLATRVSSNPVQILEAYVNERFTGNLPELLEPDNSRVLYPYLLENQRLPINFGKSVLNCKKNCRNCDYCHEAFESATIRLSEGGILNVNE